MQSRRDFIKKAGAITIASLVDPREALSSTKDPLDVHLRNVTLGVKKWIDYS